MKNFRRNQINFSKNELDGNSKEETEKVEEIEEIEVIRYDSEDLYPTNINFKIQGNPDLSRGEKTFNVYHSKFPTNKNIPPLNTRPICTCKHPDQNCQNMNIQNRMYHFPTNANVCPYCIIENETLINPKIPIKTEIPNRFINQNRTIKNNDVEVMKTLPTLYRREIPYPNQKIYYSNSNLPSAKIPMCSCRRNNLNNMTNNNLYMFKQKTNNFIIDNEPIPPSQINIKNLNKMLNKSENTQKEKTDVNINETKNDNEENNNNANISENQNIAESQEKNELNEEKEKNY